MIYDSQVLGHAPKGGPDSHSRWCQANGYGYLAPYKDQYGAEATIMVRCELIRVPEAYGRSLLLRVLVMVENEKRRMIMVSRL